MQPIVTSLFIALVHHKRMNQLHTSQPAVFSKEVSSSEAFFHKLSTDCIWADSALTPAPSPECSQMFFTTEKVVPTYLSTCKQCFQTVREAVARDKMQALTPSCSAGLKPLECWHIQHHSVFAPLHPLLRTPQCWERRRVKGQQQCMIDSVTVEIGTSLKDMKGHNY